MEFYAFDLMSWPYLKAPAKYPMPNSMYDPELGRKLYEDCFSLVELYERLGFAAVCFNEHHATPYGTMPSPNLVASALSQRTKKVKLAIMGNCLPVHGHPLRVAEEIAMLDLISGGRIISGFVRGIPREYLALNVDIRESRRRFQEAWELIVKAWTEREPFDWNGEFYHYENVCIWPRPLQQPHPPIIYPGESQDSLEWAAQKKVSVAVTYRPTADIRQTFQRFRELGKKHDFEVKPENLVVMRQVYVGNTDDQARKEVEPHLDYHWKYLCYQQKDVADILRRKNPNVPWKAGGMKFWELDFDICQNDGYTLIGSPRTVIEAIKEQKRELDLGIFIGMFHFGSMPAELARRSVELFAKEVLPEVRDL